MSCVAGHVVHKSSVIVANRYIVGEVYKTSDGRKSRSAVAGVSAAIIVGEVSGHIFVSKRRAIKGNANLRSCRTPKGQRSPAGHGRDQVIDSLIETAWPACQVVKKGLPLVSRNRRSVGVDDSDDLRGDIESFIEVIVGAIAVEE